GGVHGTARHRRCEHGPHSDRRGYSTALHGRYGWRVGRSGNHAGEQPIPGGPGRPPALVGPSGENTPVVAGAWTPRLEQFRSHRRRRWSDRVVRLAELGRPLGTTCSAVVARVDSATEATGKRCQ